METDKKIIIVIIYGRGGGWMKQRNVIIISKGSALNYPHNIIILNMYLVRTRYNNIYNSRTSIEKSLFLNYRHNKILYYGRLSGNNNNIYSFRHGVIR